MDPRVTMGCTDIALGSGGALTNMGFDINDVKGGGSDGSRSRDLIVGPNVEPVGCGVREVRKRKGARGTPIVASRATEGSLVNEFNEASRERGYIAASRARPCLFGRSTDIVRDIPSG
jgi:hypothetical protein